MDLFNSDFSDEEDKDILSVKITETENEELDLSEISDEESSYILLTEDENIRIKDETIIFIATNKNTTIRLPYLKGCNPIKKKNGKLYKTKKIVIKALREQYSHNVFPAKKNTINGNAGIYMLKPGVAVTFYSLDKSWYADR